MLAFAGEHKLTLLSTFFAAPKRDISYTMPSPNAGIDRYRIHYILAPQRDRRLVRDLSVRSPPPPLENPEPYHNLASVRRSASGVGVSTRSRREMEHPKRRLVDMRMVVGDPQLRRVMPSRWLPSNFNPYPMTLS